jgi:autotransporter strand-loop-strand O-heptosyltransferase
MKRNAPFFENLVKNPICYIEKDPIINISFKFGATVTIQGYSRKKYKVEFWDSSTNNLEFSTTLRSGLFASPSRKYVVKWEIKIYDGDILVKTDKVDFKNKAVHVFIESTSIGDTLSWMPQTLRFAEINGCKLVLTTFHNDLFRKKYPQILWNTPGTGLPDHNYSYSIGYHYGNDLLNKTTVDPRTVPLGKVPCDILGIQYEEVRPLLDFEPLTIPPIEKPYVCIATASTAGSKLWQRANGWQDVVDYLKEKGYEVAVIQKEPTELKNILDWTGEKSLSERMNQLHHAEFFIGLGSGLSWLAWAVKKKVILISGFSDAFSEFQIDCERIINKDVCNSCWNDTSFGFNKGDWNWCPRHKDTDRQFECTVQIPPSAIFEKIEKIIVSK